MEIQLLNCDQNFQIDYTEDFPTETIQMALKNPLNLPQ